MAAWGGWLAAAVIAVAALLRMRRWRRWAATLAERAAAEGGRGDRPPADSGWSLEQEALSTAIDAGLQRRDSLAREVGRLAGVIDGMVEGVVVIDGEGTVLIANTRAGVLLDLSAGEGYAGRSLAELSRHPDLHDLVRLVRSEGSWDEPMVQEIAVGTGSQLTLQVTASRLTAREDLERWFVLVFHDISEIRQLERIRRDFVANVSHELRTPLAAIGGYTETLLSGAMDDRERATRFLGIIERHSDRLGRLVDDLLTLSDLELGRTELRRAQQDACRIVNACFETLRGKAEAAGVAVENGVASDLVPLHADADRLEQALLNLIDNAIKYTPSGGTVRVEAGPANVSDAPEGSATHPAEEYIELVVSDTGVGVPPEDLDRLTERFYRVDKARSRELGGTGLGLAIVKHIVQAHGGWMRIESALHEGTRVRLALPAYARRSGRDSAEAR